jgi:hypothetical protein
MGEQKRRESKERDYKQEITEIHRNILRSRIASGDEGQKKINQWIGITALFFGLAYFALDREEERKCIMLVAFMVFAQLGFFQYQVFKSQNEAVEMLNESLQEDPPPPSSGPAIQ